MGALISTLARARWRKKYALACAMFVVGSLALFADKLTGGEWVAMCGTVLGLFSAADVAEKRGGQYGDVDS